MRWELVCFLTALALLPTSRASACGGFFCSSSPINQARESVAYAYEDDGTLTMSIQIQYQGRDEDFAWILPLPVEPSEIGVGTDALFDALAIATNPRFVLDRPRIEGTCARVACDYRRYDGSCSLGCAFTDAEHGSAASDASAGSAADGGGSTIQILSQGVVGPYDTVVLEASTAGEVMTWLGEHGYDIPATSEPLLQPYADRGFVFIALRLNANRDSSVIRPIVLRLPTDEACLPIRLTAVATTPNLPIALYFLADRQAFSTTYSTADVSVDPRWWRGGSSWDGSVAARVRELGGQAFATDFADATPPIDIELPDVLDLASEDDVAEAVQAVQARGYLATPLLLEIFGRFITPPSSSTLQRYLNCLGINSVARCGAPERYDAAGLANAIETEITLPRREAEAMVERHAYLTRLSTSMRAEDMTLDPEFGLDDGLPDVPRARSATIVTRCGDGEFFQDHAPQEIEVDGVAYPFREGRALSDESYCGERGGTVRDGGSGCAAGRGRSAPLVSLFMVGLFAAFRIARRIRR